MSDRDKYKGTFIGKPDQTEPQDQSSGESSPAFLRNRYDQINRALQNSLMDISDVMQTGDEASDETQKKMQEDAGQLKNDYEAVRKLQEKNPGKNDKGKQKRLSRLANGIRQKTAAVDKARLLGSFKEILCSPITWIVIVISIVFAMTVFAYGIIQDELTERAKEGKYTEEYSSEEHEDIMQAWMGVFYKKYAEMSLYAMVDTSGLTAGNKDICAGNIEDAGGDEGIDACSGETFTQLTGKSLAEIRQDRMYQQGTSEWTDLGISDTDHKDRYLGISVGVLAMLNDYLNDGYLNPEQLIRPVAASCTADFAGFMNDSSNDIDKDGKVTLKDCQLKDESLAETEEGDNGIPSWDDPSLYLSYIKSTGFDEVEDNGSIVRKSDTDEKVTGQWDYGLGTLVHYQAVYQPSRIHEYYIDQIQYVCSGDGETAGMTLDACKGHGFGDVVSVYDETHSGRLDLSALQGIYADAYIPPSDLYYRDWHENAERFNEHLETASSVYDGIHGEYRDAGIDREDWKSEPAVSTGIPQTEVKYVIDYALTFAGAVEFKTDQQWISQAVAEHTQYLRYTNEKADLESAENPYPSIGSNTGSVKNYSLARCLYYSGERKQCGYHTGAFLQWVPDGYRSYTESETVLTADGEVSVEKLYSVPAHFEDSSGNLYRYGSIIGNISDQDALKSYGSVSDERSVYTWGAVVSAIVSIHKQGDLQTYAVQYTSGTPTAVDSVGVDYLRQYISNYQSLIGMKETDSEWTCYQAETDLSEEELSNYQTASTVQAGTNVSSLAYQYGFGLEQEGDESVFCYADHPVSSVESLDLNHLPALQLYSMAGSMGFRTDQETEETEQQVLPLANSIRISPGKAADSQLSETMMKTDVYGNTVADIVSTVSGQYGVDARLLALIIAEENSTTGNITGISPRPQDTEGYTAYNLSTRARTTEHLGGSYFSQDRQTLNEYLISFFQNLFTGNTGQGASVSAGSKETFFVTKETLEKGGMLIGSESGTLVEVLDPGILQADEMMIERAKNIYAFYATNGYSDTQISALLALYQIHSGLVPLSIEGNPSKAEEMTKEEILAYSHAKGKDCICIGLLGWDEERGIALLEYAASEGKQWFDLQTQLSFSVITDPVKTLQDRNLFPDTSLNDAVIYIMEKYEGLSGSSSQLAQRISCADMWYRRITDGELGENFLRESLVDSEKTDSFAGSHVEILSGAAISAKAAAMHLQSLQVKYAYNIPMVITAYGLGESFMDAVLEVYEKETGVAPEEAMENLQDTAWADYRYEVFENPERYGIVLQEGKTYDYAERVLSRLSAGTGISYQKIDTRYLQEDDKEDPEADAVMHTIGTWYTDETYDSLMDSSGAAANASAAAVSRAWRLLTKESGNENLSEDQWKDLTCGLIKYPETIDISQLSDMYEADSDYILIRPDLSAESVTQLINRILSFGTEAGYGEEDYASSEFWQEHFSKLLGSSTALWKSVISAEDLFGTNEDGTQVNYYGLTDTGVITVRPYGYVTDEFGDRTYSDAVTYQDMKKISSRIYCPFDGTVIGTGKAEDGYYAYVRLLPPNGRTDLMMIFSGMDSLNVSEGDGTESYIGTSNAEGIFEVSFLIDGEFADYEDIVQSMENTRKADHAGLIGYVSSLGVDYGNGTVYNEAPNITVPVSLEGMTWKDLLGESAQNRPNQYAGHETWLSSGIYMANGFGGDFPMTEGSPIYAVADGWIARCDDSGGSNGGKANYITYAFKGEDSYIYSINIWHIQNNSCAAIASSNSGIVKKGDVIARVGNTGISTGSHAHIFMNRMPQGYDPGESSSIFTRTVCSVNTSVPCAVAINALFNY